MLSCNAKSVVHADTPEDTAAVRKHNGCFLFSLLFFEHQRETARPSSFGLGSSPFAAVDLMLQEHVLCASCVPFLCCCRYRYALELYIDIHLSCIVSSAHHCCVVCMLTNEVCSCPRKCNKLNQHAFSLTKPVEFVLFTAGSGDNC